MNRMFVVSSPARRVCSLLLIFAMLLGLAGLTAGTAWAYDIKTGVTSTGSDYLNVRSGPGTGNAAIGNLPNGAEVTIVGEETDSGGAVWYKIEFNDGYGYVHSNYVTLDDEDADVQPSDSGTGDEDVQPSDSGTGDEDVQPSDSGTGDEDVQPSDSGTGDEDVQPSDSGTGDEDVQPSDSGTGDEDVQPSDSGTGDEDVQPSDSGTGDEDVQPSDPGADQEPEISFEEYLVQQGFPESYHESLIQLHEQYPNWVFKAQQTGLDWEASLDKQVAIPKSLVEPYWPSSWKLVSDAAFDWDTDAWIAFDGRWVAASREALAYYMDPRNFLTQTSVFQFLDQRFDETTQTVEGVEQIIAGTFMENDVVDTDGTTLDYAQAIYNAGVTYGVSPYVLASMIRTEQGTEGSGLSSGTYPGYEGYFNFYNVQAFATSTQTAVETGLIYAKGGVNGTGTSYGRPWNTRLRAINGGAEFYASGYLDKGQCTLYLKRFNVQGDAPYTHQYATSVYSAKVEGDTLSKAYSEEMRTLALTFYIPVYENMPETASVKPTKDGCPNMKLESLEVEGYEMTPAFDADTLEYSLIVSDHLDSVVVKADAMCSCTNSKVTVDGAGQVELTEVSNVVEITVTAENGDTRIYTINIAKEDMGISGKVTFSEQYTPVDLNIFIAPGVTAADLIAEVVTVGKASVLQADGSAKEEGAAMATGDEIHIYDDAGGEYGIFYAVVKGDVNGDGKITIHDIIKVRNYMLSTDALVGASLLAADVNGDTKCSIHDIVSIRNYMLGTTAAS